MHAILALRPVPLYDIAERVPKVFAEVVMNLLSKDPQERYQSAGAILRALRAEDGFRTAANTRPRSPARLVARNAGVSEWKSRLVGRTREQDRLRIILSEVQAGGAAIVSVSGFSGTGKTSLVRETMAPFIRGRTVFLYGKFDRESSAPYSAFVQASSSHIRRALLGSESEVSAWKTRASRHLSVLYADLMGVFRELGTLLGLSERTPNASSAFTVRLYDSFGPGMRPALLSCSSSMIYSGPTPRTWSSVLLLPGQTSPDFRDLLWSS